jgi:hypothetical protein
MYYTEAGIGVELMVQSTSYTRKFLNDLPERFGEPVDPESLHLTAMYPEELARAGLGATEQAKLPEAANTILARIGEVGIIGARLRTVKGILWPYKKFVAVKLIEDEWSNTNICNDVRRLASDVVSETIGVRLRTYLDDYHVSVTRRNSRNGTRRALTYNRHFPAEFTVVGCNVSVRSVNYTTDGQPQQYQNCCYSQRL